jgi:hypothetical protein
MTCEIDFCYSSNDGNALHFVLTVDLPFEPKAGMALLPADFVTPAIVTLAVWSIPTRGWLVEAVGTADLTELTKKLTLLGVPYQMGRDDRDG